MDWVEGPEETTLWLWIDSPDTVTVRFERENWEEFKEKARQEGESVPSAITHLVESFVDGGKAVEYLQD